MIINPPYLKPGVKATQDTTTYPKSKAAAPYKRKLNHYLELPSFSVSSIPWLGSSFCVIKFYYTNDKNISLPKIEEPDNINYVPVLHYIDETTGESIRLKFWYHENMRLHCNIYDGRKLPGDFAIEIWPDHEETTVENLTPFAIETSYLAIPVDTCFNDSPSLDAIFYEVGIDNLMDDLTTYTFSGVDGDYWTFDRLGFSTFVDFTSDYVPAPTAPYYQIDNVHSVNNGYPTALLWWNYFADTDPDLFEIERSWRTYGTDSYTVTTFTVSGSYHYASRNLWTEDVNVCPVYPQPHFVRGRYRVRAKKDGVYSSWSDYEDVYTPHKDAVSLYWATQSSLAGSRVVLAGNNFNETEQASIGYIFTKRAYPGTGDRTVIACQFDIYNPYSWMLVGVAFSGAPLNWVFEVQLINKFGMSNMYTNFPVNSGHLLGES